MDEEPIPIVIAARPPKDYFPVILHRAAINEEMTLQFTDHNAATAEFILRLLRKGCGWREITRTRTIVNVNTCRYKNPENAQCTHKTAHRGECKESVRQQCKHYSPKKGITMLVNKVLIEKVAQARGL